MGNNHQHFDGSIGGNRVNHSPQKTPDEILIQNFRTAAEGCGEYCPIKDELRIRKGRKVYRFTCGEFELRFVAPGHEEEIFILASDTKVHEFMRCFTDLTGTTECIRH